MPDVLIRAGAGASIGLGHLMRAHFLACALRDLGLSVGIAPTSLEALAFAGPPEAWVAADAPASLIIRDIAGGSTVAEVEADRRTGAPVVLVDDDGPAAARAALVVNALGVPGVAVGAPRLCGLEYAIVHPSAAGAHGTPPPGTGAICICFGGSDPTHLGLRLARALHEAGFRGPATVFADAAVLSEAEALVGSWHDSRALPLGGDVIPHMAAADLVVTKIGLLQLEAFCVGRSVATIEPTPAHVALQARFARERPVWPATSFGLAATCDLDRAANGIIGLAATAAHRAAEAARLVDGRGVQRVAGAVSELLQGRGGA
ncbi:MAG: hypothetical protein WCZ23_14550 [Rhodospirillaceae bacterium]